METVTVAATASVPKQSPCFRVTKRLHPQPVRLFKKAGTNTKTIQVTKPPKMLPNTTLAPAPVRPIKARLHPKSGHTTFRICHAHIVKYNKQGQVTETTTRRTAEWTSTMATTAATRQTTATQHGVAWVGQMAGQPLMDLFQRIPEPVAAAARALVQDVLAEVAAVAKLAPNHHPTND
jgi:hypothetical protein